MEVTRELRPNCEETCNECRGGDWPGRDAGGVYGVRWGASGVRVEENAFLAWKRGMCTQSD